MLAVEIKELFRIAAPALPAPAAYRTSCT